MQSVLIILLSVGMNREIGPAVQKLMQKCFYSESHSLENSLFAEQQQLQQLQVHLHQQQMYEKQAAGQIAAIKSTQLQQQQHQHKVQLQQLAENLLTEQQQQLGPRQLGGQQSQLGQKQLGAQQQQQQIGQRQLDGQKLLTQRQDQLLTYPAMY